MICIISTNDSQLQNIAAKSSTKNKSVFGDWFEVFDQAMPKLKADEDLFIISTSAAQDDRGNAVIGDEQNDLFLNGVDVWDSIKDIFPKNYSGNVYVDVCQSPESDPFVFNFIENFWDQINPVFSTTKVFGRNGTSKGLIPLPTENGWETTWTAETTSAIPQVKNGRTVIGSFANNRFTSYSKPIPNPQMTQANKYFTFSETGNIMMVTTDSDPSFMSQPVQEVFNQVSAFWASMTKAIAATTDPATSMPYSIYDYEAIERVISGCGHFVPMTQELVQFRSNNYGEQFSQELVSTLLGVPTGTGELNFAHPMICSMGNAAWNISRNNTSKNVKIGTVVFICEYLMGTPCVSTVVVHADMSENSRAFRMGPCVNRTPVTSTWNLYKDTYMFVTPAFIKEYSGDLRTAVSNVEYNDMVGYISNLVTRQAHINSVTTTGVNPISAPQTLIPNTEYLLRGENFGEREGMVRIGSEWVTVRGWFNDVIKFVTPNEPLPAEAQIDLFMHGNNNDPVACTPESYTVGVVKEPVFNN